MIQRLKPLLLCIALSSQAFGQTQPSAPAVKTEEPAASAAAAGTPKPAEESGGYGKASSAASAKLGYNSVRVSEPYVALTFDDGPHASLTPKLLDLLKARHVKATFYVVGENAAEYPDILKRAVAEGHEIGNHSWSHPNLAKMGEEAVRSQIQRTQEAVIRATGITPTTMRPPYGSITERERHLLHDSLGFKIIMWSVDPLDWKDRNAATVSRRILSETRPGSIILSHDIHASTVEAMPNVIDSLIAKGFKFATVSELIAMDQPGLKPENVPEPAAKPKKTKKSK